MESSETTGRAERSGTGGYPHAMLREIYAQPEALAATLDAFTRPAAAQPAATRPIAEVGITLRDEAFETALHALAGQDSMLIAASGSSRHAGLVGRFLFEELAGLPVDVEYASEYIYRSSHTPSARCVLVLSQSGETADTLEALREAKMRDAATIAITNREASSMAALADCALTTRAGVEEAVPATKSFTAQLLMLQLLALFTARARGRMTSAAVGARLAMLMQVPEQVKAALPGWQAAAEQIAGEMHQAETYLFLGRAIHFPIAWEGALKLKESAYVHAEGYPTGELKHGPAALLSDEVPLVVLATKDRSSPDSVLRYEKTLHLLREMRARRTPMIAVASEADEIVPEICSHTMFIPKSCEQVSPLFEVIPLQLLAYCTAIRRGADVDRPRNLVKAVVVE